ncbi:putative glycosyltransferase Hoc1p [[Candida] railenensis]|uniref:Glycosyltransferase Hoc1p n=1 Tax=[Candida] railenensis TaxID=45579 RepID=A0A9P0QP46_9ASCO|nr:putative glycosyltransferase Hoc1p [[Candida] railenensis]
MPSFFSRRKPIFITIVVILFLLVVTKLSTSKESAAKNLQDALSIPNDNNLLSSIALLSSQHKEDEFLQKLEKIHKKLLDKQEQRLVLLEEQNIMLVKELNSLKKPPHDASLRDKLVHLYPYDRSVKFPAYIWQSWKHGLNDERFDEKFRQGETEWAWKNPGFVHELFNDDTANAMIHHLYVSIPEIVRAYDMLPEVILKMDFFRYLILFARGGAYADIDTVPLQPIPNWIPENVSPNELGMIIAVDIDSSASNWREIYWRRLQFGQFILQAKPGHPILREIIAQITELTLERSNNDELNLGDSVAAKGLELQKWTGCGRWTDVVMTYFNDYMQSSIYSKITWKEFHKLKVPKLVSDVLVLPISSFASELEIPKDGKIEDPLAFAKHYAGKIWKTT